MNLSSEDLRRMEQEDEAARQGNDYEPDIESNWSIYRMTDGRTILDYETFLGTRKILKQHRFVCDVETVRKHAWCSSCLNQPTHTQHTPQPNKMYTMI
jgi:hypothetical protein